MHDIFFRRKIVSRVQRVNELAAGKGLGKVTANQINVDEPMIERKRGAGVTRIDQVEAFMVGRRVRNKRCSAM